MVEEGMPINLVSILHLTLLPFHLVAPTVAI